MSPRAALVEPPAAPPVEEVPMLYEADDPGPFGGAEAWDTEFENGDER